MGNRANVTERRRRTQVPLNGLEALHNWFPAHGAHDLLPVPFVGNLETAKIVILMGNPGASPAEGENAEGAEEAEAELTCKRFKKILHTSLRDGGALHGFYLREESGLVGIAPGYEYWNTEVRLNCLTGHFPTWRKWILDHFLILQLYPYHSNSMQRIPGGLEERLPSAQHTRRAAVAFLEQAWRGKIFLFYGRCLGRWGIEPVEAPGFSGYQLNRGKFSLASQGVLEAIEPWIRGHTDRGT